MRRILGSAVVLVAVLMLFTPASRAEIYLGGSIVQTTVELDKTSFDFDEDDTGVKIFGGWTFFKFIGLEAGYYDMGSPENNQGKLDVRALGFSARGILPIGKKFELFAKAGYLAWDVESTLLNDDDVASAYGAGVAWVFGDHLSIRAEYEILDHDEISMDLYSLGAAFRF